MGDRALAFFARGIPEMVNAGAEAYGARKALTRQEDYQNWFRDMVEEQHRTSREDLQSYRDENLSLIRAMLGLDPVTGERMGMGGVHRPQPGTPEYQQAQQFGESLYQGLPPMPEYENRAAEKFWTQPDEKRFQREAERKYRAYMGD